MISRRALSLVNTKCPNNSFCTSYTMGPQSKYFPVKKTCMLPKDTFVGRTAFITGGGTGIGLGISKMLAQLGANVVISSRKQEVLDKAAEEIKKETGNQNILPLSADVRDMKAICDVLDQCESKLGLPSLVVNNAAGNFISPTERLSSNAFATILDIVLKGTANVTLETGKRLIKANQSGSFVSITTVYVESGSGFVVPSASAKAGIEAMSKSLSSEWARYGLRFNTIAPGPVYTKGAFSRLDPSGEFTALAVKRNPTGRMGEIVELANLATYLLSDYASWINGTCVRFDGGEYPSMAGEMNALKRVTPEQWDTLEMMIRQVKGS